ncbi:STM3941 family protein [Sphingorhabdus sp. Alg231-15]|uniref:STM3941 family protein n=1 Tax=Sphingorhabdus sp. Alg231-15 TaxID=1922222 RepID=UPI000D5573DA
MDDFVAHASRSRTILLSMASVAFVVTGMWMIGAFGAIPGSTRYSPVLINGIGWFCIVFFGFSTVTWIKNLFDESEQLRISPTGVRWKKWSDQMIPWAEISDITEWSYQRQRFIILHLQNPEMFPSQGLLAWLAKANQRLAGGDIALSLTATDRTLEEAMAAIDRFRSVSPSSS